MRKRIVVTVGGTGGHVYPAMSLAKQLQAADVELLFVGGRLKNNRFFQGDTYPFHEIACGTLSLKKPLTSLKNAGLILQGIYQSYQLLQKYSPQLVVGFGSYHTLPTLLAAKLLSIPVVLHEANRIPGKVNRLLSKYALVTGVYFPDTAMMLKGKTVEMSLPLREGYRLGTVTSADARAYFKLDPATTTLLVFGGSQGAQHLNKLVVDAVSRLKGRPVQVLHFTGDASASEQIRNRYAENGIKSTVKDFEPRMDLAWQAADLMISRSGAGTLAEEMEFEVPGILIPYPHAADNHQSSNADFIVTIVRGAIKREEKGLTSVALAHDIVTLLSNDQEELKVMRQAIHEYKRQTMSLDLGTVVLELLKGR